MSIYLLNIASQDIITFVIIDQLNLGAYIFLLNLFDVLYCTYTVNVYTAG